MSIITQAELEARLGTQVARAMLDDDNDGEVDAVAVDQLLADATSKVMGYALAAGYSLAALTASPPNELKRLALDAAEVLLARRFPSSQRNWQELKAANEEELKGLRTGITQLDVANGGGIEPPATQLTSVRVLNGINEPDELPDRVFDDMGDF